MLAARPMRLPWSEAVVDRGAEVDAAVEAGDRRLLAGIEEGVEAARGEAALVVGVVDERVALPEQIGEHLEGGARLDGVARGILGEGRRDEQRQPVGVELSAGVRHRAKQVVAVLLEPAGDESIRDRHPDPRVCLGRLREAGAFSPQHLAW